MKSVIIASLIASAAAFAPVSQKASSSAFIKEKKWVINEFSWQTGFGVFSYTKALAPVVTAYILNQPAHHEKKKFQQEYLEFLNEFEIDYNERYLFEFYE